MINLSKTFKVFISCQLVLLQLSVALSESQTRILSGTPTTIDKAPFLVQLRKYGRFHCGGALISPQHVATAAHCVKNASPESIMVVAGASTVTDSGVRSRVSKIMVPRVYNQHTFNVDVAVMKLEKPISGPSIRTAGNCTKTWKHGDKVELFGWGQLQEDNYNMPLQLQTVDVEVIDQEVCKSKYHQRATITPSMFCAASPGKDACAGDSGGPVLINGEYCGIVSWGIGCGDYDSPGVYTSVPYVMPFINNCLQQ